ncbi:MULTISPECIES: hypothetical protein [unclassified Streptomyces]|nr:MULTISPECIES: hypothetical protein [unclassified Streptomyces]
MLECQDRPAAPAVLSGSAYAMANRALIHSGTTQVPTAERLLVE